MLEVYVTLASIVGLLMLSLVDGIASYFEIVVFGFAFDYHLMSLPVVDFVDPHSFVICFVVVVAIIVVVVVIEDLSGFDFRCYYPALIDFFYFVLQCNILIQIGLFEGIANFPNFLCLFIELYVIYI